MTTKRTRCACDAFEHFPPAILNPVLVTAKSKALFPIAIQAMRLLIARKRAFNGLAHSDIDHLARTWVEDFRHLTLSSRREVTTGVAARLPEFEKPALIAWSADDVFFEQGDGVRLAATLPKAHLEIIDEARTFSMVDQPD